MDIEEKIVDEVVNEENQIATKKSTKEKQTKEYKVIAIKPTFVVLQCGDEIISIECNYNKYKLDEIIEL
jgi:hypothetical protein